MKIQKYIPIFILSILFFSIIAYLNFIPQENQENEISGAYQALNALGAQRVYPYKTLPEKAHFAAWKEAKTMQNEEKGNSVVDPWESMGPYNFGGRTLNITLNPQNDQTIYLGSASGGLWRSHTGGDGEMAWHRVPTGFPVLGVSTIAIESTDTMTMYIGTGEVYNYEAAGTGAAFRSTRGSYGMGILKTIDGGQTWTKSLDWTYAQNRGIWMIKIDPLNADIVWSATTDGIYKSTDAGSTWDKMLDVVMGTDLIIHPTNTDQIIAACGNLGSPNRGIYKTIDGGENWTKSTDSALPTDFQGKIQINYAPSNPNIVYASIGNGFWFNDGATWLLRSDDFGEDWVLKNTEDYSLWQGWFAHDVAVNPVDPDKITTIGITVWQSDNGGSNIIEKTEGGGNWGEPVQGCSTPTDFVHSDAHDVLYHPSDPNIIYVASDGGFSKSINGGNTFTTCSGGYQTVQFYNGFASSQSDPNFAMGGLQDNGTIVYDGDKIWNTVRGGDGSWAAINPDDDNIRYASLQFLSIARSINGSNFQNISPNTQGEETAFIAPYRIAPSDSKILYAATTKVYKTDSYGDDWTATASGNELDGNPVLCMEVSAQNEDVVYVGTAPFITEPSAFITTNGGATWQEISDGLPQRYPMDVTVDPNDEATAYIVYSGFGTGHVFKTTNYGTTWSDITGTLPDAPTNAVIVDPANSQHVYVGNDIGVFSSTDGGVTWEAFQDGLATAVMIFDLNISPSNRKLRIATHGNGAYQRDLLEQDVNVANENITSLNIEMNLFPNPVSEILNVKFNLEEKASAFIELSDLSGKLIYKSNPTDFNKGENIEQIDVSKLSTANYICTLHMNGQVISRKIQVVK